MPKKNLKGKISNEYAGHILYGHGYEKLAIFYTQSTIQLNEFTLRATT